MKILKLKLFQETACYKKPFAFKVAETYPLPPYSTVIGMCHKVIGAKPGEFYPMNVSVQGEYESIFSNYQNLRMFKGNDKVTAMPRNNAESADLAATDHGSIHAAHEHGCATRFCFSRGDRSLGRR